MSSRTTQHQTLWWLSALSGFNHAVVSLGMVVLAPVILKSHYFLSLLSFSTADKLKLLGLLLAVKPACEALTAFICSRLSLSSVRTILLSCFSLILLALALFASAMMLGYLSLLFVAQAVFGVGGAMIYLIETVISQTAERHLQARAFNLLEWSVGLGLLLGPIVSGYFAVPAMGIVSSIGLKAGLGVGVVFSLMGTLASNIKSGTCTKSKNTELSDAIVGGQPPAVGNF